MSLPNTGYSSNVLCGLNLIYFLLLGWKSLHILPFLSIHVWKKQDMIQCTKTLLWQGWENKVMSIVRRLCRYKRGNHNPYIEDEQTTQWPKKKDKLKDKQRSTKHTHKTKDQVTQTTCTENRGMNSGTPEG